jgi:hypothetical protein
MASPHHDFDERAADLRRALADLRAEVDEFRIHLEGSPAPVLPGASVEPGVGGASLERAPDPGVNQRFAEPAGTRAGEWGPVAGGARPDTRTFDQEDVVPERLVTKSDADLARTFDIASSLLGDAEERRDVQAIAYWRSLAAAALEEARRRPEFGNVSGASRLSPRRIVERRHRRLVAQLEEARERAAVRGADRRP